MPNWFDGLGISASGLTAERLRMDVISNNIANAETTRTAAGGPYRREVVELSPGGQSFSSMLQSAMGSAPSGLLADNEAGVQVGGVVQDQTPFKVVYDPTNPDAVNGYVQMPNVDISTEMVDMMSASRAYEANATAFDSQKQMISTALSLGK